MSLAAYKLSRTRGLSKAWSLAIVITCLSFPPNLYLSMRFGTAIPIEAFVSLAAFFFFRNEELTKKDLNYTLIFLALAGGVKASGLIAMPLFLILAITKSRNWGGLISRLLHVFGRASIALVFSFILNFPPIVFAPFQPWILEHYLNNLIQFASSSAKSSLAFAPAPELLQVLSLSIGIPAALMLSIGAFLGWRERKYPAISAMIISISIFFYINASINSTLSRASYLTALLPVSIIVIITLIRERPTRLLAGALILASVVSLAVPPFEQATTDAQPWNMAYYKIQDVEQSGEKKRAELISKAIGLSRGRRWAKTVVLDYSIKTEIYNSGSNSGCTVWVFDNLDKVLNQCPLKPDFLILDKAKFKSANSTAEDVNLTADRNLRAELQTTNSLKDLQFTKIISIGDAVIYKLKP